MIVFDLQCDRGHRFEGWFSSSSEFERQRTAALIACPSCGSAAVAKAVMAPAIGRKGNQLPAPGRSVQPAASEPASAPLKAGPVPQAKAAPQAIALLHALATMQARALQGSRWVGNTFAEDARAMHYGERETETIHGRATATEAEALLEEGIVVTALPFPIAPPEQAN